MANTMSEMKRTIECEECHTPVRIAKMGSHFRRHHSEQYPYQWPNTTRAVRRILGAAILWCLELDGDIEAPNSVAVLRDRLRKRGVDVEAQQLTSAVAWLRRELGLIDCVITPNSKRTSAIHLTARTLPMPNPFVGKDAAVPPPEPARVVESLPDRLRAYIEKAGAHGVTRTELRRDVAGNRMTTEQFDAALNEVAELAYADKRTVRSSGNGRMAEVWIATEHLNKPATYAYGTNGAAAKEAEASADLTTVFERSETIDVGPVVVRDTPAPPDAGALVQAPATHPPTWGSGNAVTIADDGLPVDYRLPEPPPADKLTDILLQMSALTNQAMIVSLTAQAATPPARNDDMDAIAERLAAALERSETLARKLRDTEETARAEKMRNDGLAKMNRRLEANIAAMMNQTPVNDGPFKDLSRMVAEAPRTGARA